MVTVSAFELHDDRLELRWNDGATSTYPWIWIRDHAHDEATLHPFTQQRQLWTACAIFCVKPWSVLFKRYKCIIIRSSALQINSRSQA